MKMRSSNWWLVGVGARVSVVENGYARTFRRDGDTVTDPVLSDGASSFTPGLSVRNGGSSRFFFDDRMGTATKETDSAQLVTATRTYDAFGSMVASSGSSPSPFGYAGGYGYQEDATGLKLLGHRYYDPETGRFLTRDPIQDGMNWYGYCSNNPLRWVDPEGLWVEDVAAGWGDTLTLGATKYPRKWLGEMLGIGDANESVDCDSGAYHVGEALGIAHTTALGAAGGWATGGAKGAGREFSHWVPNRFLKKMPKRIRKWGRTKWNGNYVKPMRHAKHDPYRYVKGMTKDKKWHPVVQQLDRVPAVYYGGAAGFGAGYGHSKYAQ